MNIINRSIEQIIRELSKKYPVITITGHRQSGKTTLAKKMFPGKEYISLENPDLRELAEMDPRSFLAKIKDGAVLDEIQRTPNILSYLQEAVDQDPEKGKYILTGSNQFLLMNEISQSLAGRTVILKLLPLTINEAGLFEHKYNTNQLLYRGFYPGIYKDGLNPTIAYRSYFETYIERDLRQMVHIKNLHTFQTFVRLCAGRIGQVFNASNLSNEIGVSVPSIKAWISILEASYIVFLLPPYFENIGKQLIKTPKLYFHDVGLAAYLLSIEIDKQIERDPLRGALFENLVVSELMKMRYNQGLDHNMFFYRDKHQNEIDIIFKKGRQLIPLEVKSARTFTPSFLKNLHYFKKIFPNNIEGGFVVYDGDAEQQIQNFRIVNYRNISDILV